MPLLRSSRVSLSGPNTFSQTISILPSRPSTSLYRSSNVTSTFVQSRSYAEDKKKEKDDKKDMKPKKDAKAAATPAAAAAAETPAEEEKMVYKGVNPLKALRVKPKKVDLSILPLDTSKLDYNVRVAMITKRLPLVEIKPKWEQDKLDWDKTRLLEQHKRWEEASDLRLEMELKFRAAKTSKKQKKQMSTQVAAPKKKKMDEEKGILDVEVEKKVYPLLTEHDESGNVRTLYRKLTQNLYLLIRKTADSPWEFPSTAWSVGDKSCIRKTANRAVIENVGDDVDHFILGNAPVDFLDTPSKGGEKPTDRVRFSIIHTFVRSVFLRKIQRKLRKIFSDKVFPRTFFESF